MARDSDGGVMALQEHLKRTIQTIEAHFASGGSRVSSGSADLTRKSEAKTTR